MRGPVFVRDERVLWRHIVDGVLISPPGREMLTVQGSGADLWELLSDPHSAASAAAVLGARLSHAPDRLVGEIQSALDELAERGAIRRTMPLEVA